MNLHLLFVTSEYRYISVQTVRTDGSLFGMLQNDSGI